MKRFVAALFMMTTGLLPVFAADPTDFFISSGSGANASARVSVPEDPAAQSRQWNENNRRDGTLRCTILHFDSKLGDISLQPIVGKLNGVQLYVSF
jgi:hypothetical protein